MGGVQTSRRRRILANSFGIVLLVVLVAIGLAVLSGRIEGGGSTIVVSPGVFAPGITVGSLYPNNDPWAAYLAPESACPDAETRSASVEAQQQTIICLLNWARRRRGLTPLREQPLLSRAAAFKARDIDICEQFAHEACGKAADAVVTEAAYGPAGWGENLYLGPGEFGRPRVAVDGWLNSTGHRENLFRADWTEQGVALLEVPSFNGQRNVAIWVSHFGHR